MLTKYYERKFHGTYFHQSQPIGRCFNPGEIGGYYNDLTGKADYTGPANPAGVPLRQVPGQGLVEMPVSATQMALGLYDRWLMRKMEPDREKFLSLARYLMSTGQSRPEGIVWIYDFDMPTYRLKGPFISAMGQGQAISVLVRAHKLTGEERYLSVAREAMRPMGIPVVAGGVGIDTIHGWWLEEYPTTPPSFVLNGCIFAIWGLNDLALAGHDPAKELFLRVTDTLEQALPAFDIAGWSRYDLFPFVMPQMTSPFYHQLHIAQLDAMAQLTGNRTFAHFGHHWLQAAGSEFKASCAIAHWAAFRVTKAAQRRLRTIVGRDR
jgi:heparosan-N-sulfate-glucuronate 5-epimerase